MKTLTELKEQRNNLVSALQNTYKTDEGAVILKAMKEIDKEIKTAERLQALKHFNNKQDELRRLAAIAWDCEQPNEDITTNTGEIHKVKGKKYPKLNALQYAHLKFQDSKLISISINGNKFEMYRTKYEYNKPTEYTRPETFAAFLELNVICPESITLPEYEQFCNNLEQLNADLEAAIKKYDYGLKGINNSKMAYWGLSSQQNMHQYKYLPRY